MYPVPSRCPICQHSGLIVTGLDCPTCQVSISGQFQLSALHRLTTEQMQFVETFIRSEGKINRVEEEMGLSYTAVRARLTEVIATLNDQDLTPPATQTASTHRAAARLSPPPAATPPAAPAVDTTAEQRQEILARVSAGEISSVEAAKLLNELQKH